jgi:hypothetical protein
MAKKQNWQADWIVAALRLFGGLFVGSWSGPAHGYG